MKYFLIHLLVAFFLSSCMGQKSKFISNIESKGLSEEEKFSVLEKVNDSVLFIGGESKFLSKESLIFKTTDSGKNWVRVYDGIGSINQISSIDGVVFFVRNYYDENNKFYKELLCSGDEGKNWEVINYEGEILKAVFINKEQYILFVNHLNKDKVIITFDGGEHWKDIERFKGNKYMNQSFSFGFNNLLYGIVGQSFRADSLSLFCLNLDNDDYHTLIIPKEIIVRKLKVTEEGKVLLIGEKEKKIVVYTIDESKKLKLINSFLINEQYQLLDVFLKKDIIGILVNDSTKHTHFNNYCFLYSFDEGKTFKKEDEFETIIFDPYVETSNKVLGYLGNGKMRIINFDEIVNE